MCKGSTGKTAECSKVFEFILKRRNEEMLEYDVLSLKEKVNIPSLKTDDIVIIKGDVRFNIPKNDVNRYVVHPMGNRLVQKKMCINILQHFTYAYFLDYYVSLNICDIDVLYTNKQHVYEFDFNHPQMFYLISFDFRDKQIQIPVNKVNSAIVNFEPMFAYNLYVPLREFYDKGWNILDYSVSHQMQFPKQLHLPYQCNPVEIDHLKELIRPTPEYDVAMVGNNTGRRQRAIDELQKLGVKIVFVSGWNDERDSQIGNCKVLLNIHGHDEHTGYIVYEELRCTRWMFAGLKVISEESQDQELLMTSGVDFHPYDELVAKTYEYLQKSDYVPNTEELQKCAEERKKKLEFFIEKFAL